MPSTRNVVQRASRSAGGRGRYANPASSQSATEADEVARASARAARRQQYIADRKAQGKSGT